MLKILTLSDLMSNDTKAIVVSNLVLASAIMAATGKLQFGDATIKEVFNAFESFASLLKNEG